MFILLIGFQVGYSSPTQNAIREDLSLSLAEVNISSFFLSFFVNQDLVNIMLNIYQICNTTHTANIKQISPANP